MNAKKNVRIGLSVFAVLVLGFLWLRWGPTAGRCRSPA